MSNPFEAARPFWRSKPKTDPEWLRHEYVDKKRSTLDIAEEVGMTAGGIWWRLRALGIKRRTPAEASRLPSSTEKNSRANSGPLASKWQGGRVVERDGYISIYRPGHPFANATGRVMEHRLVVEERIGRYLDPEEIIHHLNENKQDNRDENLEIRENVEHLREHLRKWRNRRALLAALPEVKK